MNRKTIATLAAAALIAPAMPLHAEEGPMKELSLTMSVKSAAGHVLVGVSLHNQSAHAVHVPRALASENELFGKMFEITDAATGEPVEYQGIMVKRGPMTAEDYLTLKPKAKHRNTIDITNSYAFKPGKRTYRLSYEGSYLLDLKKLGQAAGAEVALTAPAVTFTHEAK
ncbi:hypothetical protein [Pseudoduganella namucuonensis]|uniref:Uncharacterized protein n=1 Tax=Pseudoduganella namucuonensis TaxID=1035707 RepID=A0A1I7KNM0_9BURK|nr:hypothetical protein [Pseudoduganella namucuonensis]SFU99011.1 hypothetical protein SAMN05216552_101861 [Pseudoduganella namucuonensis]